MKTQTKKRKTLYPKHSGKLYTGGKALDESTAKELLGWVDETDLGKPFGTDYLFKDINGVKVRCGNNTCPPIYTNRPLYFQSNAIPIMQEILRGNWRFNFEPVIIGRTGLVLNGQHQLIALVLACQEWRQNKESYEFWDKQPTIDKFVGFGVSEDDETVNTMDTAKPRTLQDVLFRSEHFANCKVKDRKKISRICSFAINTVWQRLGISQGSLLKQTHSESLDFVYRHPKILECVHHIFEEDGGEHLKAFITPGTAAGLMFLMGSSGSDPDKYKDHPCDEGLDWSNFEKAENFFTRVCNGSEDLEPVKDKLKEMLQNLQNTRKETGALLCRAWGLELEGVKLDSNSLEIDYDDSDGIPKVVPEDLGGIDQLYLRGE